MSKCKYYHSGQCWGTKNREMCNCDGDESKCDFYPEKREKAEKNKPEYEIDFLKTLEAMKEQYIAEFQAKQQEMYELAARFNELQPYIEPAAQSLFKLSIDEQVMLLKLTVAQAELCKRLCDKYGLVEYEEEPEEENDNGEI